MYLDYAEENAASLQNSVIYGFVSNVYSVNSGILTTGEFTGDAIHCKLQSLLEHLYSALRRSLVTTLTV